MPQPTQPANRSKRHLALVALLYLLVTILLVACVTEQGRVQDSTLSGITENLTIESPQGTGSEKGRQWSADLQATVGYGGVSVSGNASYAELRSSHKTVNAASGGRDADNQLRAQHNPRNQQANSNLANSNQAYNQQHAHLSGQSGLYAGDDGYQIINRGQTHLKGGIITSTQAAESNGHNRFVTDTLKLEDLENHSKSRGIGLAGGLSYNQQRNDDGSWQQGQLGKSQGGAQHHGSERSTTHASINTQSPAPSACCDKTYYAKRLMMRKFIICCRSGFSPPHHCPDNLSSG